MFKSTVNNQKKEKKKPNRNHTNLLCFLSL